MCVCYLRVRLRLLLLRLNVCLHLLRLLLLLCLHLLEDGLLLRRLQLRIVLRLLRLRLCLHHHLQSLHLKLRGKLLELRHEGLTTHRVEGRCTAHTETTDRQRIRSGTVSGRVHRAHPPAARLSTSHPLCVRVVRTQICLEEVLRVLLLLLLLLLQLLLHGQLLLIAAHVAV